ncbi:MAG: hypothetical protein E7378_02005 [Clostridiales bacterium]|nr:hypothetical protein [Clostridiales bacterium]
MINLCEPFLNTNDLMSFLCTVLSSEYAIFNKKEYCYKDFRKYISIQARSPFEIVVAVHCNFGLAPYNMYKLTPFEFKPLYPLCGKNYQESWRKFLVGKFKNYNAELEVFLKQQGKNK